LATSNRWWRGALLALVSAGLAGLVLLPVARELERRRANRAFLPRPPPAAQAPLAAFPTPDPGPSPLEVERPVFPPSAFRRRPMAPEAVQDFFHQPPQFIEHDPHCYFRFRASLDLGRTWPDDPEGGWRMVTNSFGLREDLDVARGRPDLRVLVTGDSHTDGVCPNADSFPNVLERALAASCPESTVDVLNAGKGSYSFYNYLGVLERFLPLRPDVFVVAVYGGNDFVEVLGLQHHFAGTPAADPTRYWTQVERARGPGDNCLAQSFLALKHFAHYPEEMEVALQAARDVTTEIQVTCQRQGIRLIVAYLPPLPDVVWGRRQGVFERVAAALELRPEDLELTDRMADSYLAFLRQQRIVCLDLRPAFRAAQEPLYWEQDDHISLAGHRLVAQELQPLVEEVFPEGARRVRAAPGSALDPASSEALALASPGYAGLQPEGRAMAFLVADASGPQILRWPLSLAELEALGAAPGPLVEVAPGGGTRYRPHLEASRPRAEPPGGTWTLRTNALGLRRDGELSAEKPALRVIVSGDELVSGACANADAFPARLEERLAARSGGAECLDAAVPGHGPYDAVATLERLCELRPDVLVAVFYGGDDFLEAARDHGHFHGAAPPDARAWKSGLERARKTDADATRRFLAALKLFQEDQRAARRGLEAAIGAAQELDSICRAKGIRLVVVYAPPSIDVDPARRAVLRPAIEALGLEPYGLRTVERLAARYLAALREGGIELLDLTPLLRSLEHGGLEGGDRLGPQAHRALAEALEPLVEPRSRSGDNDASAR
jgi:lysophospholipase L1-like esterase